MGLTRGITLAIGASIALAACSVLNIGEPTCPPVDPGGECFAPSDAGFAEHALTSATAWPQLDGIPLSAGDVIHGFDEVADQPTWVVPLLADGQVVGASRFLPFGDDVRLAEIALYQPPRATFPSPAAGQGLKLTLATGCYDPGAGECLFTSYGWRLDSVE
ncbi:MAG: hypothetical protein H0V87_12020 [Chloroflexi bacterium]|nr:hypothetical protein [Chloroflexota bacterium]